MRAGLQLKSAIDAERPVAIPQFPPASNNPPRPEHILHFSRMSLANCFGFEHETLQS